MDVFVQRGGPAFVLDGYQWYSGTSPLCRVMRGGKKKGTRNIWGRKNRARDGRKQEHSISKQEALLRMMVIVDLCLDFKATISSDKKETIKLESSYKFEVSQCTLNLSTQVHSAAAPHQSLGPMAGSDKVTEAGASRADEERLAETAMHACKNSACVCVF